jgi:hypothetical protein
VVEVVYDYRRIRECGLKVKGAEGLYPKVTYFYLLRVTSELSLELS